MCLQQILLDAQSAQLAVRVAAEQKLKTAEERDLPTYVKSLATELQNEHAPETVRQLAGLLIKNAFSGMDRKIDKARRDRWMQTPADAAEVVKSAALKTLPTECEGARAAACQVIAKVARVDLQLNRWDSLIPTLLRFSTDEDVYARKGALTAYGFICEDIRLLAEEVHAYFDVFSNEAFNSILTGIVAGMKDNDLSIKLIATRALYHAMIFAYRNFQNEEERQYIFRTIGDNLKCPDEAIQQAAWECVLQMASEYYEYLEPYMEDLCRLSLGTISTGRESTALPAVEFWNNICDEEIQIQEGESERTSRNFVAQAKKVLLPVLFEAMTKQTSEECEVGEWTLPMAAGTCVGLCAEVLKDEILELALQYVNANFGHEKWQNREAAVFAYGSIMGGPSAKALRPLVEDSFTNLCNGLNDSSVAVRDTTAWTVGRIAKFQYQCVMPLLGTPGQPGLLNLLIGKLGDEPRVAQQICFAIHEIAEYNAVSIESGSQTSPLTVWVPLLVEALYTTAQRPDATECKLRQAAYTALCSVLLRVDNTAKQSLAVEVLGNILNILERSVDDQYSDDIAALQADVCICTEMCFRIAPKAVTQQYAQRAYRLLWRVIFSNAPFDELSNPSQITSTASEEALLAIASLATSLEADFTPYAANFVRILHFGLSNRDDESLCEKALDLIGDLARALSKGILQHAQLLLGEVYNLLKDASATPPLKPKAMTALGDVALSVGGDFEAFLSPFLQILKQATQTRIDHGPMENEEWVDFIQNLRDAVLWAYGGILFGLRSDHRLTHFQPAVCDIIEFTRLIAEDPSSSNSNLIKAMEMLRDLIATFPEIVEHLKQPDGPVRKLCDRSYRNGDAEVARHSKLLDNMVN